MSKSHESVVVDALPECHFCGHERPKRATVDGKTQMGPWAYMCDRHFEELGVGLGLGRGQRLVVMP